MNFYIKNYNSFIRLVKVIFTKEDNSLNSCDIADENLIIIDKEVLFLYDNYTISKKEFTNIDMLNNSDIILIKENGIVYRLFSFKENEATVYLTGHCNSNCIMCPCSDGERLYDDGLDDNLMLQYIDLLPATISHIVVTGGEPTLRTNMFFTVMKLLADKFYNTEILLLTNGRSFSINKILLELKNYCPPYLYVGIPIHSYDASIHDYITSVEGSFGQTDIGIQNLLNSGIFVEIRIVITRFNYTSLEKISELIINKYKKVKKVNFMAMEIRGNCAKNFQKIYVDYYSTFIYMKYAIQLLINAGIDVAIYNFPLCAIDKGFWSICKKSISPSKIVYDDNCNICSMKQNCGGFFYTTFSMVHPCVKPILLCE